MTNRWILLMALFLPISIQAANDTIIRHFTDTVTAVTYVSDSTLKQREVVIPADSTSRRGHYVQAHIGLGYGSLGYSLEGAENHVNGSFSALLQLQYAYFFHPHWGIGAGIWFTNYTSFAHIGGNYSWLDQIDTDLEHYDHTASVQAWRERESIHNIGIPISLQFQYEKDNWKARIFAALGLAPAFSVMKQYKVAEGEIDHTAYYPTWNLLLMNTHEFGTKTYEQKGSLDVRTQVDIFADFGALLPLTKQIDLFLGGYFNCALNDANSSSKHALGWKDDTFTFMEEYTGAYALDMAGASHPWEAGVKVGIHWHYISPDRHATEDYYEPFTRPDTTYRYIPRADTTIVALPDEPEESVIAQEPQEDTTPARIVIDEQEMKEMRFRKVFFEFDSYELTPETQAYLNSIIDVLKSIPEAKIMLDGHASEEGEPAYNDILSMRRAQTVRDYLVSQGIDGERIETIGHGSLIPNDEEGVVLKRDRRVEIKVIQNNNEK